MPRLIEPSVRHPVVPPIADAGWRNRQNSPKLFQTMPRAACEARGPNWIGAVALFARLQFHRSWHGAARSRRLHHGPGGVPGKNRRSGNVVRMRYGARPWISGRLLGYQRIRGSGTVGGQGRQSVLTWTATIPSNQVTLGGNVTYLDRPTITYTPLTGDRFAKPLLRPIPPNAIFELVQAGYPADLILLMTTRDINGVYNRSSAGGRPPRARPGFLSAPGRIAAPATFRRRQPAAGKARCRRGES